jgi:hypothetical protein
MLKMVFPFVEIGALIRAPHAGVWDILTDTACWNEWGPTITAVDSTDRYIRKGSSGRVRTISGVWLPFVITEFDDGTFWSWRVAGINATGHRVEQIDKKTTMVFFRVSVYAAPYILVCKLALLKISKLIQVQKT